MPLWSTLLAVLIGLPWFRGGYLLSYDMLWVPKLDLGRSDLWGFGTALPRAVPSDAVIAVLGAAVDPVVVQRGVLFLTLVLAGVGAARLVDKLGALPQLAAATFAVWNPFIAERLVMGHWPLLVGYAALFWLIDAARRGRTGIVVLSLIATSLTPVSGLMGVFALVVVSRRLLVPIGVGLVANAPWIVASVVNGGGISPDSAGVGAFAIQPEGPLGRLGAAFSLGGIWNAEVVPTSRTLVVASLVTALAWLVMAFGAREFWRSDVRFARSMSLLGATGLVIATAGWWGIGLMELLVDQIGPFALLRDGTRWLALLAPLESTLLAFGVHRWMQRMNDEVWRSFAVVCLFLPLAALPDLANGVDGRLTPVAYPDDWSTARAAIEESPVGGDVVVLPFTIYRQPRWNESRKVLDPAGKWFSRDTVTDDALIVGNETIAGEDPRARQVRTALKGGLQPGELGSAGIGLVVVDTTAPGGATALAAVDALEPVLSTGTLRVFSDPNVTARARSGTKDAAVKLAWLVWICAAVVGAVATRTKRLRHDAEDGPSS